MTDNNRDWLRQVVESEVKKALLPDQAVMPPINVPESSSPDNSNSSSGSNTSDSGNSSKGT
jgi:hypothetical protein